MYFIYKVIHKQTRQIVFCSDTKIISDELVSGETLLKLQAANKVFEIAPEILIERFSMFKEITDNCQHSRYFSFGNSNWELYLESNPQKQEGEFGPGNRKEKTKFIQTAH